jgi:Uma2 family endonuclease
MISLKEALQMGTNAPKSHQRIIARLILELGTKYYNEGSISLEPLPETMLDEGQTSPTPDVILYDNVLEQTPVIIEVTHSSGVQNDLKKVRELIEETEYGITEGFVYDYKKNLWHKYKKGYGIITRRPSYCNTLKLDLSTLLADNR